MQFDSLEALVVLLTDDSFISEHKNYPISMLYRLLSIHGLNLKEQVNPILLRQLSLLTCIEKEIVLKNHITVELKDILNSLLTDLQSGSRELCKIKNEDEDAFTEIFTRRPKLTDNIQQNLFKLRTGGAHRFDTPTLFSKAVELVREKKYIDAIPYLKISIGNITNKLQKTDLTYFAYSNHINDLLKNITWLLDVCRRLDKQEEGITVFYECCKVTMKHVDLLSKENLKNVPLSLFAMSTYLSKLGLYKQAAHGYDTCYRLLLQRNIYDYNIEEVFLYYCRALINAFINSQVELEKVNHDLEFITQLVKLSLIEEEFYEDHLTIYLDILSLILSNEELRTNYASTCNQYLYEIIKSENLFRENVITLLNFLSKHQNDIVTKELYNLIRNNYDQAILSCGIEEPITAWNIIKRMQNVSEDKNQIQDFIRNNPYKQALKTDTNIAADKNCIYIEADFPNHLKQLIKHLKTNDKQKRNLTGTLFNLGIKNINLAIERNKLTGALVDELNAILEKIKTLQSDKNSVSDTIEIAQSIRIAALQTLDLLKKSIVLNDQITAEHGRCFDGKGTLAELLETACHKFSSYQAYNRVTYQ